MIKVLKWHMCLCTLTTSIFFFVPNIDAKVKDELACSSLFTTYPCNFVETYKEFYEPSIFAFDIDSIETMIVKKSSNIVIKVEKGKNSGIGETLQLKKSGAITSEVFVPQNMVAIVDDVSVTGNGERVGDLDKGVTHTVFGVKQGSFLIIDNSKIDVTNVHGLVGESSQIIFPDDWSFETLPKFRKDSEVVVQNSDITIKGRGAHGLYFSGRSSEYEYERGELLSRLGVFQFENTVLEVSGGTAIYIDDARRFPIITVSSNSRIFADLLLDVKNNSYMGMQVDASLLIGGARVSEESYAEIELFNKSQWTVTPASNQEKSQSTNSSISFLRLVDSFLVFEKPTSGDYQILHVGRLDSGVLDNGFLDYVYLAKGDSHLFINTYLAMNGKNRGMKADKLFIYGNVYGKTKVHVVEDLERRESYNQGEQGGGQSVSVIHVYGKAEEDSFELATGYVTLRGAPYRYYLRAYGPGSSLGKAKDEDRLVRQKPVNGNGGDFWDFRLEAEYMQPSSHRSHSQLENSQVKSKFSRRRAPRSVESSADLNYVVGDSEVSVVLHPEVRVKAVVPQVPTYLLLPNALFHAGLMDVSNQNKQLKTMRTSVGGLLVNSENPAFFVRGYGGNHRYISDLSALEYGYKGNLDYNAVKAGVLLKAIESAHCTTTLGIMGIYGKISLKPQDVEQSKKSVFDKWSVAAYGSLQHDMGFYLDGLFSYGLFKGDVLTLARGKTATLKGNLLGASLIGGKTFVTGYEGLVFDPQIQVIYQNLQFDKTSDIDGFDIEMAKPEQWLMRVGGRLTKTLTASDEGRVVSFNGKFHLVHSFEEKQFVRFKDAFQLGAFGSSLEIGLGFNIQLSSKFTFHGDATYQHQLSKAGFSGTGFSGSFRYRF
ncbi:autotransporter family protein [Bartonella sp. B39]